MFQERLLLLIGHAGGDIIFFFVKMKDNDKYFELEPVLDYIGPKGKWLMFQNVCLFFFGLASGLAGVSYAFPGYAPKYRCLVPLCGESLNTTLYYHKINDLHEKLPLCQRMISTEDIIGIQNCDQYVNELQSANNNNISKEIFLETCKKSELVFDRSIVESSLVEDFDMTCSDVFQKDLINSVFMIGAIIGSLCNGIMADNFGRMKIITLALVLMGLPGIVSALWVNKWVYILFRILAGIGTLH